MKYNIGKYISEYPAIVVLVKILNKITFGVIHLFPFCLYMLDGVPDIKQARGKGIVRQGVFEDVAYMSELNNKKDIFVERFKNDEKCIVAVHGDKIIGYEWFSDKPLHCEERFFYSIEVPPGAVYAYDAYIMPEYRISGVWIKFKSYLGEYMQKNNINNIITLIDFDNVVSQKTHIKFGFKPFRHVVAVKIFSKYYYV